MKSKISTIYWRIVAYAAEGLSGALRETFMTNSRIFALVIGLDLENPQ